MKNSFSDTLKRAQSGDILALEELCAHFHPTLMKQSYINSKFDPDLLQELYLTLLRTIRMFKN